MCIRGSNVIGLMFFTLILFGGRNIFIHLGYFSTRMLLCFFVLNILLLEAERMAIRLFLRSLRTNGYNQKLSLIHISCQGSGPCSGAGIYRTCGYGDPRRLL